jgi:hypothetical protein
MRHDFAFYVALYVYATIFYLRKYWWLGFFPLAFELGYWLGEVDQPIIIIGGP